GDPVQGAVVEGEEDAVRGGPGVGFEVGVAEADGVLEGGPGILRLMRRAAPVREREGEGVVEVGNGTALINVCSQHAAQYRLFVTMFGEQRTSSRRGFGVRLPTAGPAVVSRGPPGPRLPIRAAARRPAR